MEENIYKNAKVVVVDDVEEVLRSTKNCLEFEDMQVICFSNPLEGLEYLKKNKADVLLLDFFMPQMNGDEFVENLRKENQETIVILQTGYSDKIPPLEMIDKMNIQGYLDKLKGEDELVLMTKAAIKTSFLNKQLREKDKEIAKLSYKKSITGNLVADLVNEAKDQLMQISGMSSVIKSDSDDYTDECKGIDNALAKTYALYEALNFETLTDINYSKLVDILKILLKPTIMIHSANLEINASNISATVEGNISDISYLILKVAEIMAKNNVRDINITIENSKKALFSSSTSIENVDFSEIEMLVNNYNIENNNSIVCNL